MSLKRSTTGTKHLCVGIWRLLEQFHCGRWTELFYAQPAEAAGSPRADYVVKMVTEDLDAQMEGQTQLCNEAAAIRSASHPNLIALLDAQLSAARPYLVFPRLEAHPLSVWLGNAYNQPVPVCLWWLRQAAQGLASLHNAGWIHGDIKPDNLLVSVRGHLTLIDCGLSRPAGGAADSGRFQGTPEYAAPEVISGDSIVAPEADVYSLGVVFYQMLTRQRRQTAGNNLDLAELKLRQVAEPLIELIGQMTKSIAAQRPSAERLIEEIFRLEIETLGMHIQPDGDRPIRAA